MLYTMGSRWSSGIDRIVESGWLVRSLESLDLRLRLNQVTALFSHSELGRKRKVAKEQRRKERDNANIAAGYFLSLATLRLCPFAPLR